MEQKNQLQVDNNMEFREVKEEELDGLIEVARNSIKIDFPHYSVKIKDYHLKHDFDAETIKQNYSRKIFWYWGAFLNKKIVGYLISLPSFGGVALIIWLGIDKVYQRKGIGKKFLEEFANWAKKQGVHALHLYTVKEDLTFYQKLGFIKAGKIEKSYYGNEDYYLYKILQEPKEENFLKN